MRRRIGRGSAGKGEHVAAALQQARQTGPSAEQVSRFLVAKGHNTWMPFRRLATKMPKLGTMIFSLSEDEDWPKVELYVISTASPFP